MRTVVTLTVILCSLFVLGCPNEKSSLSATSGYTQVSAKKPFDAMPPAWATQPEFSYRMYSYYPYDFVHGGMNQPYYHNPIAY